VGRVLRFKIDQNLPKEVAVLLDSQGHDARTVKDQGLYGIGDSDLSELCRSVGRVIVTLDSDFSNVRSYPPFEHPGIIVLRRTKRASCRP
jgi:predicted nuclease of predicted toxin-antitoxin system